MNCSHWIFRAPCSSNTSRASVLLFALLGFASTLTDIRAGEFPPLSTPLPEAVGAVDRYFTQAITDHESLLGVNQVVAHEQVISEQIISERVISDHVLSEHTIETTSGLRTVEPMGWSILPDGLLYKSYLAGPHEPRIGMVIFSDTEEGVYWDATLGGRVGLLRYGSLGSSDPNGWQWDLEGAVMVRLDVMSSEDVDSMDFRFGTLITRADGPWSAKMGYFHISSHVGDEYLERYPLFERVNYVTESLVFGLSYQASDPLRLYGEFAYGVKASGGAKPVQIQTGAEYVPAPLSPQRGGPFAAVNLDIRQVVDFSPTMNLQAGWQWQGPESKRRLRFGLQYLNGYTTQFQFYDQREEQIGGGLWFDY
ncbi:hypothetical protein Pla52o_13360 [Novipirellula galeiformis]|uniref:DUF1207 domain-containing protein n=1 Tax=Novipirellula galeiformis TaxID=2528004 RepID=A0A5C6CQE8_9BACT|nr:hypothetical protein Pla52o_13360 [Novipirellula galeiformis]